MKIKKVVLRIFLGITVFYLDSPFSWMRLCIDLVMFHKDFLFFSVKKSLTVAFLLQFFSSKLYWWVKNSYKLFPLFWGSMILHTFFLSRKSRETFHLKKSLRFLNFNMKRNSLKNFVSIFCASKKMGWKIFYAYLNDFLKIY